MTLSDLLTARAKTHHHRTCIKFENRKITFSDLDRRASLCAGGLKSLGLKDKDRVAILMHNCPEYIVTYFAVIRAGGIVVPINTLLTPNEISYILNDSCSRILVYSDSFADYMKDIKENIPLLDDVVFDEIQGAKMYHHKSTDDDTAVLLYTSGTTGFPKGAMLTHRNLVSNADSSNQVMHLSHKDRILLFLPLFHSFTFTVCVILPVYSGATIILLKSVRPFSQVIRSIFRDRITFLVAVPAIYNILAKKRIPFFLRVVFKLFVNLRACVSGASALPESTLNEFEKRFNVPLIEGYGLTEASPVVAVNPLRGIRKHSSVGPAIPGVKTMIINDDGDMAPAGKEGELLIRGDNVMKGYFNKEEETAFAIRSGWLHTGDIARMDEDGYIYIIDRKKDLIIVDGMNIYPREVESLVERHAAVDECAMVGIPDDRGSEITVLFIKKRENANITYNEIISYLRRGVARYKIPKRIEFIEDFPKTATGKIKKAELRKWKL